MYTQHYMSTRISKTRVRVMMFNATFNNISFITWPAVLLVKETEVPGENHRPTETSLLKKYVKTSMVPI
jgi:hypothetical protein